MADLELHAIENSHGKGGDEELINKKITGGFTGLTKAELLRIEEEDKFWRNLRIVLFILFWVIWVGLLVASVVIVILTPKCPPKPVLNGWEKSCMYRVNPFAFKDSDGDKVGDINGLKSKLDYITKTLDSQTIILDSILKGEFGNKYLHQTTDFKQIDPSLGTMEDLTTFARDSRKQGQTLIVTLDINSISVDHPWMKKDGYAITVDDTFAWNGSHGKSTTCRFDNKTYYTSVGTVDTNKTCLVVDLNYDNVEVKNEIKKVVEFWLKDVGVGGILLTNVAYLVENVSDPTAEGAKTGQTFTPGTNELLKELKSVFEEVNKVNSKKKVLMVEAGDLIEGIEKDKADKILDFFPNADVVLVRDFLAQRGWKSSTSSGNKFTLLNWNKKYEQSTKSNNPIAKSIADPYHLRHDDLEAIAGVYLLPGLPIIYFGTELGMTITNIATRLTNSMEDTKKPLDLPFYPKSARSIPYLNSASNNDIYQKDVFLSSVMPWNSKGGFSKNATTQDYEAYNKLFATPDNVQLHSATGAPANFLTLIKQLSKLRQKESILWGKLEFIEDTEDVTGYKRLVFTRSAEGHNKIIVVFMTQRTLADGSKDKGSAVSLVSQCSEARVRVTYPPNSQLPTGQVIPTEDVYIDTSSGQSLNVFECE